MCVRFPGIHSPLVVDIVDAEPKGSKVDGGMVGVGRVAELDLQQGEIVDDGRRDTGDDEQHGSSEEGKGADVVEEAGSRHLGRCDWYAD